MIDPAYLDAGPVFSCPDFMALYITLPSNIFSLFIIFLIHPKLLRSRCRSRSLLAPRLNELTQTRTIQNIVHPYPNPQSTILYIANLTCTPNRPRLWNDICMRQPLNTRPHIYHNRCPGSQLHSTPDSIHYHSETHPPTSECIRSVFARNPFPHVTSTTPFKLQNYLKSMQISIIFPTHQFWHRGNFA